MLNIQKIPRCINKNKATEVCAKKGCNIVNPFICVQCKNNECYLRHQECNQRIGNYKNFNKKLQLSRPKISEEFKEYVEIIDDVFEKTIHFIEKQKEKFDKWKQQIGFPESVAKYYQIINSGRYDLLTGNNLFQLARRLTFKYQIKIKDKKIIDASIADIYRITNNLLNHFKNLYIQNYVVEQEIPPQLLNVKIQPIKPIEQKKSKPMTPIEAFLKQNQQFLDDINKYVNDNELNLGNMLPSPKHIILIEFIETPNIIKLLLNDNKIMSIEPLTAANFKNLKFLSLQYNSINNLSPLTRVNFPKLQYLNLSYNQIQSLEPLINVDFLNLITLHLNYNQILSIKSLVNVNFKKLRILNLYDNNIDQLNPLLKFDFPNLQTLNLYNNKFTQIQIKKYLIKIQERYNGVFLRLS